MRSFLNRGGDDTPGTPPVTPAPTPGTGWNAITGPRKVALLAGGVGAVVVVCMWPSAKPPLAPLHTDPNQTAPSTVVAVEDSPPQATTVTNRIMGTPDVPVVHHKRRPAPSEMALYVDKPLLAPAAAPRPGAAPLADGETPPALPGGGVPPPGAGSALDRELGGATHLPTSHATLVTNPTYLIRAGDEIPCLPVEALDSSLPGFTTCRLTDWYRSSDQRRGLLPPGTRIFGQIKSGLAQGVVRLGILYTVIQTPWFDQPINAPAADAMGRSGVDGDVHTFFWDKLGAVALYSLLDVAVGAGQNVASSAMTRAFNGNSGTTLNLGSQGQSLGSAEFGATINRPAILTRDPALPITVVVGQNLDFTDACTRAMHVNPMACPLL